MVFFAIFIVLTAAVVMLGVEKGIEKVSKILMPVLMLLIIGIGVYTLTLPGAIDGLIYYVKPDLSEFSIKTVIAARGAFLLYVPCHGNYDYLWLIYA